METPRSLQAIAEVFAQAAEGLAAAHRAGLVHRDFKPENVLIGEDEAASRSVGRVRVVDFGLARMVSDLEPARPVAGADTHSSTLHGGTPSYMALEQFEGGDIARADDRPSSMEAFIVALRRLESPPRHRVLALVGVAALATAGMGAYTLLRSPEAPPVETVAAAADSDQSDQYVCPADAEPDARSCDELADHLLVSRRLGGAVRFSARLCRGRSAMSRGHRMERHARLRAAGVQRRDGRSLDFAVRAGGCLVLCRRGERAVRDGRGR